MMSSPTLCVTELPAPFTAALEEAAYMKPVLHKTVLGNEVSVDRAQRFALQARLKVAWHKWSQIRGQLRDKSASVQKRVGLLEAVVLSALLWGLETVNLTAPERSRIDVFQRTLVHRLVQVPRRATEDIRTFLRRRERICTKMIAKTARAKWGRLQRYRVFTFAGHVARLEAPAHAAATVLKWRDDRWWDTFRAELPARTRGQLGRRAPDMSVPGAVEKPFRDALELVRRSPTTRDAWRRLQQEMRATPRAWRAMAQNHVAWKTFSRYCSFERDL